MVRMAGKVINLAPWACKFGKDWCTDGLSRSLGTRGPISRIIIFEFEFSRRLID